jgi:hypothetical protein
MLLSPNILRRSLMSDSVYLTKARAEQALALAEPTILELMKTVASRKALHVVILGVDGQVLHERSIGPDVEADQKRLVTCIEIARSKARIHFRTGRPAAEVQARRPHALLVGDTIWGGSASHEGIIVAASGVQGYYDESISGMVAAIFWGLCMDAQAAYMGKPEKATIYKDTV